jgi:inosose dehydratase
VVHYHNHVGTWIETPVELDRLVHHIHPGTIDLCFDTGHYAYGGGNPLDFIKQNLARIGYLHLKDVDAEVLAQARREGWSFLEALRHIIFCPLGAGSAQIPETIRHLVARRFTGWVIIEQDTCQGDATVNARANLETVRRLERLAPPDPEVTR